MRNKNSKAELKQNNFNEDSYGHVRQLVSSP